MSGKRLLGITVVGLGRWAIQHHIPAILDVEDTKIVAIVDPDPAKRDLARRMLGTGLIVAERVTDLDGVVDAIDACIIASPPGAHGDTALACLERGWHVLIEKPMTLAPRTSVEIARRADELGLIALVGYPLQHTSLRDWLAIALPRIGELHTISCCYRSPRRHLFEGAWRVRGDRTHPASSTYRDVAVAGGGQLRTEFSHALCMILSVVPADVVSAIAIAHPEEPSVIETRVAGLITFDTGALMSFTSDGLAASPQTVTRAIVFSGRDGEVRCDLGGGATSLTLESGVVEHGPAQGEYPASAPVRHLTDVLRGRADPARASAWLGALVDAVLDASYSSIANGGPPIAVQAPGRRF